MGQERRHEAKRHWVRSGPENSLQTGHETICPSIYPTHPEPAAQISVFIYPDHAKEVEKVQKVPDTLATHGNSHLRGTFPHCLRVTHVWGPGTALHSAWLSK